MTAVPENSETSSEALYLDSVDEALRKGRRRGAPKGPRQPRRQVNDIAIRQLRLVERQRRLLASQLAPLTEPCKTCGQPRTLEPIALSALVKASANVSDQIVRLSQSIRLGYEAERKAFEGLTEDQLEAVFRQQLGRIALDDADKRVILVGWFGDDVADVLLKTRAA